MLKSLSMPLAAFALVAAPYTTLAQDEEAAEIDAAETDVAEADAPEKDTRIFSPVNFDQSVKPENIWVLDLSNGERVKIRLMEEWAPKHIERIKTLTAEGFYNGVVFHRVIDGFMAQSGDPTGTGQGASKLPDLEEEFNPMPHVRGTVSMARANEENSANSQFFIVFYPRFSLDKRYTNFGRVIENMGAVDTIVRGEPPANPTRILQASLASENRAAPSVAPPRVEAEVTADMLSAPLETQ